MFIVLYLLLFVGRIAGVRIVEPDEDGWVEENFTNVDVPLDSVATLKKQGLGLAAVELALKDASVKKALALEHFDIDTYPTAASEESWQVGTKVAVIGIKRSSPRAWLYKLHAGYDGVRLLMLPELEAAPQFQAIDNTFGAESQSLFDTIAKLIRNGQVVFPFGLMWEGMLHQQHMVVGIMSVEDSSITSFVLRDSLIMSMLRRPFSHTCTFEVRGVKVDHQFYHLQSALPVVGDGRVCGAHTIALLARIADEWCEGGVSEDGWETVDATRFFESDLENKALKAIADAIYGM